MQNKKNDKDSPLEFFTAQIRKQLGDNLKQIILFGSRARGENLQDSDYDCLLIVKETSRIVKDTVDEVAGEALYQYSAIISAIIISEEKYSQQKYSPLLMNVAREGVPL